MFKQEATCRFPAPDGFVWHAGSSDVFPETEKGKEFCDSSESPNGNHVLGSLSVVDETLVYLEDVSTLDKGACITSDDDHTMKKLCEHGAVVSPLTLTDDGFDLEIEVWLNVFNSVFFSPFWVKKDEF